MSCLNVIYDLKHEPLHFGILPSLVCADVERERLDLQWCRIYAVMASGDGFRQKSRRDKTSNNQEKYWRLHYLILSATRLLPSCMSSSIFDDRELFFEISAQLTPIIPSIGPGSDGDAMDSEWMFGKHKATIRLAKKGVDIQRLMATEYAKTSASNWAASRAQGRPVISLTLRQSSFLEGRNSNILEWVKFADYIETKGFVPIFVPDTEASLNGRLDLPGRFIVNELAALNMEIRNAFYEVCDLNYFVGNGPCFLPYFNKNIDYIVCNLLVPGYPTEEPEHYEALGLPVGSQMPGQANGYGKLVWEPDNADVLIREFDLWCGARKLGNA